MDDIDKDDDNGSGGSAQKLRELEEQLAELVREAALSETAFDEIDVQLAEIKKQGLNAANSIHKKRQIQRGVAAARAHIAELTEQPVEKCAEIMNEYSELGYSNLNAKASRIAAFCRYCLERNAPDVAKKYVDQVTEELQTRIDEEKIGDDTEWERYLNTYEDLRRKIKTSPDSGDGG